MFYEELGTEVAARAGVSILHAAQERQRVKTKTKWRKANKGIKRRPKNKPAKIIDNQPINKFRAELPETQAVTEEAFAEMFPEEAKDPENLVPKWKEGTMKAKDVPMKAWEQKTGEKDCINDEDPMKYFNFGFKEVPMDRAPKKKSKWVSPKPVGEEQIAEPVETAEATGTVEKAAA